MTETPVAGQRVYRHSIAARVTHWAWTLAMLVLVMSGLQIFNAAPYLDASDKSNPARRVLAFDGGKTPAGTPVGTTTIFGHSFTTTHVLGYTDDGAGGEEVRAFPGALTLPATQDLADGRVWHLFFGWVLLIAIVAYFIQSAIRKDFRELILRPSDIPKLLPMQLYYFRLRKEPPPHGTYNPLQKAAYTVVLFVFIPLIILTGLALSPGVDAISGPLVWLFGGRQFARTWHFTLMSILIAYFCVHMILVFSTGPWNNIKSMITGWYKLKDHDGVGI
jgi:Ni/Fe-hydrogenase b-type cytochrome subunit